MNELLMERLVFPTQMWVGFFKECGPEEMLASFRWTNPPIGARWGEDVYAFFLPVADTDNLVGWASLKRNPSELLMMEVVRGVRPKYRRRGYAAIMLEMLTDRAFSDLDASQLSRVVYDGNTEQSARSLRASELGSPWVYAGCTWYPETNQSKLYILTRQAWASRPRVSG
jgi:RimJ/RimL family protein N-acetyltransferase